MNKSISISLVIAGLLIGVALFTPFGQSSVLGAGAVCGNDIVEPGEACDGTTNCTTGCTLKVPAPACGNDIVEAGEQCDGSANCTTGCTIRPSGAVCGNDIVEAGEQCDGSANCTTGCTLSGSAPACGNDIVEAGEECDGSANCTTGCRLASTPPSGCTSNCGGGGGGGGGGSSFSSYPRLDLRQGDPIPTVPAGAKTVVRAVLTNIGTKKAESVDFYTTLTPNFSFDGQTLTSRASTTVLVTGNAFTLTSGGVTTHPRLYRLGDFSVDEQRNLYIPIMVAPGTPSGTYLIPVRARMLSTSYQYPEVEAFLKVIVGNPSVAYYAPTSTYRPVVKVTPKPKPVVVKPAPKVCISAEEYARLTATSTFAVASTTSDANNSGLLAALGGLFDLGTGSTCFGLIILLLIILALVIIARLLYHYFEDEHTTGEGDGQMPLIQ